LILTLIAAFLICNTPVSAQIQIKMDAASDSLAGTWLFPDTTDLHHPVLFLYSGGTFELADAPDFHERGDGMISGTWLRDRQTLRFHVKSSYCCQFEHGERFTSQLLGISHHLLQIHFKGRERTLKRWSERE